MVVYIASGLITHQNWVLFQTFEFISLLVLAYSSNSNYRVESDAQKAAPLNFTLGSFTFTATFGVQHESNTH